MNTKCSARARPSIAKHAVPEISAEADAGFFVFSHDITEQKRMQARLVQAQKMEPSAS